MTNSEFKVQLEKRTVAFSVAVIKTLRNIPSGLESKNIREQVMRSAAGELTRIFDNIRRTIASR